MVSTCSVKTAWVQKDGFANSTVVYSTFMPWSCFLSHSGNFSACMAPKYFMVYSKDINVQAFL